MKYFHLKILYHSFALICFLLMLLCAFLWRNPQCVAIREVLHLGFGMLCVFVMSIYAVKRHFILRSALGVYGVLFVSVILAVIFQEAGFRYKKYVVLNCIRSEELQAIGKHFIVGYTDLDELERLIQKGAVKGVYITARNIQKQSFADLKAQIAKWQSAQQKLNLPKLVITTDQEGGDISRLSPPLTLFPPLSTLVSSYIKGEKNLLIQQLQDQASEMQELGLTLNLAPVVDLKDAQSVSEDDKYSRIYQRSLSEDPKTVADIAKLYCQEFARYHIQTTLKHFPGLGSVKGDTHLQNVVTAHSFQEFQVRDWLPYQHVFSECHPWVMVSHVMALEIDSELPASLSKKVVTEVLRDELQFHGTVITDDFSMRAISGRSGGIGKASQQALSAGVDVILISYDPDLYYEAVYSLWQSYSQIKT